MVTVVNACSDLGVKVCGSEKGPLFLNEFNNDVNVITVNKLDVEKEYDEGNKKRNFKYVNEFNERLYNEIVNVNDFVLTIGGDHSIAMGSDLASKKKNGNIGLFWIDAHSDYHNMDSTITGNIHGMPFASICGENDDYLTYFCNGDYYNSKKTVLIGGRDIEDPEYINLEKAGVTVFTTEDIKKYGVKEIMKRAYDVISDMDGVHISYDLDVIDPAIAPGVSVKAVDGISKEEAYEILDEIINKKDLLKSFDLVEYNPSLDIDNKTKEIALHIINNVIDVKNI